MSRANFTGAQLADIVMQLNGEIEPVGESHIDSERYANLICLQDLVDILIDEIYCVCSYERNQEYSMKRSGRKAVEWMEAKTKYLRGIFGD